MAQATLMSWNLGALDAARANQAPAAIINYLASIIEAGQVALAAFSGIRGGLGGGLGSLLIEELYNRSLLQVEWKFGLGPALGAGRGEEYLFVWAPAALDAVALPGTDTLLQWDFPVPGQEDTVYGFPRSTHQSPDLPPLRMLFQLAGSDRQLSVALINGPDWLLGDVPGAAVYAACASLAEIAELDQGHGGLVMGTFNVPFDDDMSVAGSNGAGAFAPLAAKYAQAISRTPSVLADAPIVAMAMEEAKLQTADTIFVRRDGEKNGIGVSAAWIGDLLTEALAGLTDDGTWVPARLGMPLAVVERAVVGAADVSAEPGGSYLKLEDAFAVYRAMISPHLPALVTLTY